MDFEEKLIEEVRKHDILYDVSSNDYKNVIKKEMLWEEIGKTLISNVESCKKRWKSLRDTYKRVSSREVPRSGIAAAEPKKTWRYFEAMRFLDNVRSTRLTIGNITIKEEEEEEGPGPGPSIFCSESINLHDESVSSISSSRKRKRKKKDAHTKFSDFLEMASKNIAETIKACGKAEEEDDSTSLLFKSLALKIKKAKLSAAQLNEVEQSICNVVYNKLSNFEETEFIDLSN